MYYNSLFKLHQDGSKPAALKLLLDTPQSLLSPSRAAGTAERFPAAQCLDRYSAARTEEQDKQNSPSLGQTAAEIGPLKFILENTVSPTKSRMYSHMLPTPKHKALFTLIGFPWKVFTSSLRYL